MSTRPKRKHVVLKSEYNSISLTITIPSTCSSKIKKFTIWLMSALYHWLKIHKLFTTRLGVSLRPSFGWVHQYRLIFFFTDSFQSYVLGFDLLS